MITKVNLKTIRDINLKNKRVLVRVDYNVSLGQSAELADDQLRLTQSLPTINYLLSQNCLVILLSHLGRPAKIDLKYSLKPLVPALERLLKRRVNFIGDYLSAAGREKTKNFKLGEVILLENLRFYPGEEANDENFARQLAALGEIFVQDGFGVCHRRHASIVGITKFLPAVAGLLLVKELNLINKILKEPQRPLIVILGGAKTETKIGLIDRLLTLADKLLLGGSLANTFLKAAGYPVGRSKIDEKAIPQARQFLAKAKKLKKIIHLPQDTVVAKERILDIGLKTCREYGRLIGQAGTIIWNGPLGLIEKREYREGTEAVYQAIVRNKAAVALIGGGETLAAITQKPVPAHIYLSTGGGAMLEFIEKGTLPGIKVLSNK